MDKEKTALERWTDYEGLKMSLKEFIRIIETYTGIERLEILLKSEKSFFFASVLIADSNGKILTNDDIETEKFEGDTFTQIRLTRL